MNSPITHSTEVDWAAVGRILDTQQRIRGVHSVGTSNWGAAIWRAAIATPSPGAGGSVGAEPAVVIHLTRHPETGEVLGCDAPAPSVPLGGGEDDKSYPFYELRFIMRVLGHAGDAPKEDWHTAYGMARDIYTRWHAQQVAAHPLQAQDAAPVAEKPYAYAVYFPDQAREELVHDTEDLIEDMSNERHTVTPLFDRPDEVPAGVQGDAARWIPVIESLPDQWPFVDDSPCEVNGKAIETMYTGIKVLVAYGDDGVGIDNMVRIGADGKPWWSSFGERVTHWKLRPVHPAIAQSTARRGA